MLKISPFLSILHGRIKYHTKELEKKKRFRIYFFFLGCRKMACYKLLLKFSGWLHKMQDQWIGSVKSVTLPFMSMQMFSEADEIQAIP